MKSDGPFIQFKRAAFTNNGLPEDEPYVLDVTTYPHLATKEHVTHLVQEKKFLPVLYKGISAELAAHVKQLEPNVEALA